MSNSSQDGNKTKVTARRRRPSAPSQPADRERAEAPIRRRTDQPQATIPTTQSSGGGGGGTYGGGGGGGTYRPSGSPLGSGMSLPKIPLIAIIGIGALLLCCVIAYFAMSASQDGGGGIDWVAPTTAPYEGEPIGLEPATAVPATRVPATRVPATRVPVATPVPGKAGQTWLVMLYQDADDNVLERDIYLDLNEAERVGSSDRIQIVAQVDRFRRGFEGDGGWTSTKRFYITQDDNLESVRSEEVDDLGEAAMSDGDTLVDFVTWAVQSYPADKYVLIMSDHGMGWPGGWTDPAPGGSGRDNVALAQMGDELFLMEIDRALEEARAQAGVDKFELIGMDACLMGHVEVMSALAPHARYAVASQETEPALGWAYTSFLTALSQNPDMNGAQLAQAIVQSYVREDERIVDPQARASWMGEMSSFGSLFGAPSAEQLVRQMEGDVTLSAIDLQAMPQLMSSLNDFAYALSQADQQRVASARSYAQSFTSVFGKQVPPSYLDLGNLVQLLKSESRSSAVSQAADGVLDALGQAVIAEKHGSKKPGATGLSIYFPSSQLYRTSYAGPSSYATIANRFASESLWDDFLVYHYTGRTFDPQRGEIAVPARGAEVRGPGAGGIEVDPITLSSNTAAPGRPVLMSTEIRGQNVGYILLFVGYYDQAANSIFVADTDYLDSGETREVDGVYYPYWGDSGTIELEFEWEPLMYAIESGGERVLASFSPAEYGAAPEEAVYTVEGIYTFADGTGSKYARLYMSNGMLDQVYGYTGTDGTGSPREIVPVAGDTFTVLQKWMDVGAQGAQIEYATQQGDTLTFAGDQVNWLELDAAAGQYVVGFIVKDLDGNDYAVYTQVNVQ